VWRPTSHIPHQPARTAGQQQCHPTLCLRAAHGWRCTHSSKTRLSTCGSMCGGTQDTSAVGLASHVGTCTARRPSACDPTPFCCPPLPLLLLLLCWRSYGPGPCLGSRSSSRAATASSSGNCRLELVGSYPCWGVVCGLAVLRGKGSSEQRDSIIVVVRCAIWRKLVKGRGWLPVWPVLRCV
jgi:hypothetical protein